MAKCLSCEMKYGPKTSGLGGCYCSGDGARSVCTSVGAW